ncbi:MAG TPA: pyruvate carboxyltransferase [Patescibacteria group bacterium]|nr:pyruvate carboxyltransferase [Patescibacteria group bacterium]
MAFQHPILWIDQTLTAGLPTDRHPAAYGQLIPLLRSLYVGLTDLHPDEGYFVRLATHSGIRLPFRAIVTPVPEAVQQAHNLGFRQVILAYQHTGDTAAMKSLDQAVTLARRLRLFPALHLTNASDWPADEIIRLWNHQPGFDTPVLAYGDQDSLLDPLTTVARLTALRHALPCRLEFHAANACGLATANALGAIRAGVRRIAVAVGGLQQRPALEELLMIHKKLWNESSPPTLHLTAACRQILTLLDQAPRRNKSLIGEDIFAHESGIHVDGILKDSSLYEPFPPEEVGQHRRLVIGKHSGSASLKARFREWNLELSDPLAERLLTVVRRQAVANRGGVPDPQLWRLYQSLRTERSYSHGPSHSAPACRHHAP